VLRAVRRADHFSITLRDGTVLAGRMWLPADAAADPVPAIFEFLPYRYDNTSVRDSGRYAYLAARGFAGVRVDLRGSGNSAGIISGEYTPQELSDACEVIAWLAAQPWCNGSVGMTGISWGGFNSLQVAALQPPALKAVISACSTDDRYSDDVHYMGGCLLKDNLYWADYMFAANARPPDPAVVGAQWRSLWLERLERSPLFVHDWLRHQRRDAFWKHGSICEDYRAIRIPVYLMGAFADDYRSPVFRMLEHLDVPRRALIGPWGHVWPHLANPGPVIGWLQEERRWWDHWLKGIPNDVMDGPMLRAWMREPVDRPYGILDLEVERAGRWVGEPSWPSPNVVDRGWFLSDAMTLVDAPPTAVAIRHRSATDAGLGVGRRLTLEQRNDDGGSLTFTSPPITERFEILGLPSVTLDIAADQPIALVAVRLCDVDEGGRSDLVTMGLLNLTHAADHEHPEPLSPGRTYTVRIEMLAASHAFVRGHRIRLGISSAFWRAWPSPVPVTLTIRTGTGSHLSLPVRSPRAEDATLAPFGPLETAEPDRVISTGRRVIREIRHDPGQRRHELRHGWETERQVFLSEDIVISPDRRIETEVAYDDEPLRTSHSIEAAIGYSRPGWRARIETRTSMTSTQDEFLVSNALDAYEDEARVFSKTWSFRIPRDLT